MGINNKEELLSKLAGEFQLMNTDGTFTMLSLFEGLDREVAVNINKRVGFNINHHLRNNPETFEMSPMSFLEIACKNLQLNNQLEVSQFLFHCGYLYGLIEAASEQLRKERDGL